MNPGTPPGGPAATGSVGTPRTPGCFGALGCFSLFLALSAIVALADPPGHELPARSLAARAAAGVVAVTSFFAVEALWFGRRWVFGATAAMFLSLLAVPVLVDGARGWRGLADDPEALVVFGAYVVGTLAYVFVQARRMFGASKVSAAPRTNGGSMP